MALGIAALEYARTPSFFTMSKASGIEEEHATVSGLPTPVCEIILAGAATSIIFVATKVCSSRQNFCRDKNGTCGSSHR